MATNEWLLVRLPAQDDAPLSWAVVDDAGQLLAPPADEHDPALATMTGGRRIALLVPAADVSRFQIPLPAGNEARLLQLAPFALEDQVSEDVEQLHFAVGPRDAESGAVTTVVVNRERMTQWLARVQALQLTPAALYSEGDLAPSLPGHVTMVLSADQLLLRNEGGAPLLMPAADPLLALELLLGPEAELASVNLAVYASPEDWPHHAAAIEALRDRVASFKMQLEAGGLLALYARTLAEARPINLLQGAYRPNQAQSRGWQRWRGVAAALAGLLALHLVASGWKLHYLRAESARVEAKMADLFTRTFPGQQSGPDPHGQFQRRLAEIEGGGSQRGELLSMLAALAAAQQNVPVAKLESVSFKTGSMQLRVGAPNASTLEQYSQALRSGGYLVEILSGQSQGENYSGQLTVKAQGS